MAHAIALDPPADRLEQIGLLALFGVAGAVLFSIAVAQILLALAVVCWVALIATRHERIAVPAFFWPLLAYAGWTLVSAAFSPEPRVSLIDCKQLVLFLLVPLVYRFATGSRATTMVTVILSFAAVSAAFGIFQYAILHYDNLGQRPQGTLGHYMTYSGLLMLVLAAALARILFGRGERTWAAAVLPALAVAIAVTFTRSAAVGACAAAAMLLSLKDFRLLAVLPIVAAVFFAVAPATLSARFVNDVQPEGPEQPRSAGDAARRRAHDSRRIRSSASARTWSRCSTPSTAIRTRCRRSTRTCTTCRCRSPPSAACRRSPSGCGSSSRSWCRSAGASAGPASRFLAAAALAAVTAMLAAGMFEYNFGDSEFLMMFLILITLPFAAERPPRPA